MSLGRRGGGGAVGGGSGGRNGIGQSGYANLLNLEVDKRRFCLKKNNDWNYVPYTLNAIICVLSFDKIFATFIDYSDIFQ